MKFFPYSGTHNQAQQQEFLPIRANALPETATVRVIYWPAGYYDSDDNFITSSITNTAKNIAQRRSVYKPSPGHMAIQVYVPDTAEECYLSIGPDNTAASGTNKAKNMVPAPFKSNPIAYDGTLQNEILAFRGLGREGTIKNVDFVDATKVKDFIVKFTGVNEHLRHLKMVQRSIAALPQIEPTNITVNQALEYLDNAKYEYVNAMNEINSAKDAANSMYQTGLISIHDLAKIVAASKNLAGSKSSIINLRKKLLTIATANRDANLKNNVIVDIKQIKEALRKDIQSAEDAAGKDAFYTLRSGGVLAPKGHSCVSIVSDALCYGDKEGDFKRTIKSMKTLPTPDVFSKLFFGNIDDTQEKKKKKKKNG